jgi:hypothetical protein
MTFHAVVSTTKPALIQKFMLQILTLCMSALACIYSHEKNYGKRKR